MEELVLVFYHFQNLHFFDVIREFSQLVWTFKNGFFLTFTCSFSRCLLFELPGSKMTYSEKNMIDITCFEYTGVASVLGVPKSVSCKHFAFSKLKLILVAWLDEQNVRSRKWKSIQFGLNSYSLRFQAF